MTRHESRELAFILIFEKSFQKDISVTELIDSAVELELFPHNEFAEGLAKKVYLNLDAIDAVIEENLVGSVLGISASAVRSRIQKAKQHLKQLIPD